MSNDHPTELIIHINTFTKRTGYGLANVWAAFNRGDYVEARTLLNEQMAMNYMTDNGYYRR